MPTEDPDDNLIFWRTNKIRPADPPPDRADRVRIIGAVARVARVVLETDDGGRWRVSVAEQAPIIIGQSGPEGVPPIGHRAAVTEALRNARKSVRD